MIPNISSLWTVSVAKDEANQRERVSEEVKHSRLFPSFSPLFHLACFALLVPSERPVHSTAVKRLSYYFVLIAGFLFISKRKHGQRCINQFGNLTIFSFFLKILSFFIFSMKTLRTKSKPYWKLTQTIMSASVVKHLQNIFKSLVIKN